ncbi:MAG: dihydrofolate reductase family protein, partial [Chitinophagaceae bacterium]
IEKLQAAGIEVIQDVLAGDCRELNKRFFTFHRYGRPYIILKWAESLDGIIASAGNERTFISNEISNRFVHKWRSEEAAILVGTNTALLDDPSLTNRYWFGKNPVRVLIDMDLKIPLHAQIFSKPGKTIVFNGLKNGEEENLLFFKIHSAAPVPGQIMSALFLSGIQSLIVEGGSKTLQSFIDADLWDEARVIKATELLLVDGKRSPKLRRANLTEQITVRNDTISIYKRIV